MAYIIESLKKVNFRTHRKKENSKKWHEEDKMFIFIVILTAIITFILTIATISTIVYFTINKQYQEKEQMTFYFYTIEHNKKGK